MRKVLPTNAIRKSAVISNTYTKSFTIHIKKNWKKNLKKNLEKFEKKIEKNLKKKWKIWKKRWIFWSKSPTFMVGSRLGSSRHSKCAVVCSLTSSRLRSCVTNRGGPYWISVSGMGTSGCCSSRWMPGRLSGCSVAVRRDEWPEQRTLALVTASPAALLALHVYRPESSAVACATSNPNMPKLIDVEETRAGP